MQLHLHFGSSVRIGKLFQIPIGIHYSWVLIFGVVTVSLGAGYFPDLNPYWPEAWHWAAAVATSLLFFSSVLAHELSHSLVSRAYGIPVQSITLFMFGGIARISREASRPRAELTMALAGPACSFGIGLVSVALGLAFEFISEPISSVMLWLGAVNISLGLFNLLPGFPLDGGRVLRSILWWGLRDFLKATRLAAAAGWALATAFVLSGVGVEFLIRSSMAPDVALDEWDGLWIVFMGLFLGNMASTAYRQATARESLRGLTAMDVIARDFTPIPASTRLADVTHAGSPPGSQYCLLVVEDGRVVGLIGRNELNRIPTHLLPTTTAQEVMAPVRSYHPISPTDDVAALLDHMEQHRIHHVPVAQDGRLVGFVLLEHLSSLARKKRFWRWF